MKLPPMPEDEAANIPAWSLFANREAIEAEMTKLANDDLRERGLLEDEPAPAGFESPLQL